MELVRHPLRAGLGLALCLLLVACGGGGGGGSPAPSTLTFTPDKTSISLSAVQGQTPPSTTVTITATGSYSGTLYVAATASGQGLAASIPIAITGTTAVATISAGSGLAAGTYTGTLDLLACSDSACNTQIGNSPLKIGYTVTVAPGLVRPADAAITVGPETTSAQLGGSVPVTVTGGPPVAFTAQSDAPWLVLSQSSGTTGGSFGWSVDPSQLVALGNAADHVAHVTITPGLSSMTSVTFAVTLHEQLAQVSSLAPVQTLVSVPNPSIVVHGSGFSGISSGAPVLRFTIDGSNAGIAAAVVVADTEARLTLASLSTGAHVVNVNNALGLIVGSATVQGVAAPTYGYAAIPTGDSLRSLAYDAARDAIVAATATTGQIVRYAHGSGTSWTSTSVPFANAYDVGFSLDASALIATATAPSSSTIATLDPVTLATTNSLSLSAGSPSEFVIQSFTTLGFGIPVTNDGRSWLAIGQNSYSGYGQISYVTPSALTPVTVMTPTINTVTLGGPWYAVSRNGERLLIVQSGSVSPLQPMLYLDAVDGVVHVNPGNASFATSFSLSDDGSKAFINDVTLLDGSFATIGTATLPGAPGASTTYSAVASRISPDGSLVYVFAYRNDAATNGAVTPRVYVFSTTATSGVLNELGHFDVADYPSCAPSAVGCTPSSIAAAISLDGQTLFVAGDHNLLVIPKPGSLTPLSAGPSVKAKHTGRPATTPWLLVTH